jgi:hypothetical protein
MENEKRQHPLFFVVKEALAQHFGPRELFEPLADFIRAVRLKHGLPGPREVLRRKDNAVVWLCAQWHLAEPILAQIPRFDEQQHSKECQELAGRWREICRIEKLFTDKLGRKPRKADLLDLADEIATSHSLKVPRDARRNNKILLRWYAEKWDEIGSDVLKSFDPDLHQTPAPASTISPATIAPIVFDEEASTVDPLPVLAGSSETIEPIVFTEASNPADTPAVSAGSPAVVDGIILTQASNPVDTAPVSAGSSGIDGIAWDGDSNFIFDGSESWRDREVDRQFWDWPTPEFRFDPDRNHSDF